MLLKGIKLDFGDAKSEILELDKNPVKADLPDATDSDAGSRSNNELDS